MRQVVIVGAGGHAREVAEIFEDDNRLHPDRAIEVLGFIDENPVHHGKIVAGKPVLGDFSWFDRAPAEDAPEVICAIGSPAIAQKLVQKIHLRNQKFTRAISPRSWISPTAVLGEGIAIFPNVVINSEVTIGNYTTINIATTISHDCCIGDYCNINPGVHLAGNVQVGDLAYIGMGANIIQNISVGSGSIIGAGSVVTLDVPEKVTVVGVPAKTIEKSE